MMATGRGRNAITCASLFFAFIGLSLFTAYPKPARRSIITWPHVESKYGPIIGGPDRSRTGVREADNNLFTCVIWGSIGNPTSSYWPCASTTMLFETRPSYHGTRNVNQEPLRTPRQARQDSRRGAFSARTRQYPSRRHQSLKSPRSALFSSPEKCTKGRGVLGLVSTVLVV